LQIKILFPVLPISLQMTIVLSSSSSCLCFCLSVLLASSSDTVTLQLTWVLVTQWPFSWHVIPGMWCNLQLKV